MKFTAIIVGLIVGQGLPCSGHPHHTKYNSTGDCKSICKDLRQQFLKDVSVCLPSAQIDPIPKLFKACLSGRKKAFEQACVAVCTSSKEEFSSFEGCKTALTHKNHGPKFVDWCRKGYDDVLANIGSALLEKRSDERDLQEQVDIQATKQEPEKLTNLHAEKLVEAEQASVDQDAENLILDAIASEEETLQETEPEIEADSANDVNDSDMEAAEEPKEFIESSESDDEAEAVGRRLRRAEENSLEHIAEMYEYEPEF